MAFLRNWIATTLLGAFLGLALAAPPALADSRGNPMQVFDGRLAGLERQLAILAANRRSAEYRALLIRVAQLKAFRPNLNRLPVNEQWNCIAYLLQYASKSHRDIYPPRDDDDDDDDDDNNS